MTTPRERAQKSARNALAKGLLGTVLGVAAMLMFYSPGNQLMVIAACIGAVGAVLYIAGAIIAVRRTSGT